MESEKNIHTSSNELIIPNAQQYHDSAMPQVFSRPMPIMKYIWSNPSSPEVYQKLLQCCKLFFIKNPIIVLKNLNYQTGIGQIYCNENECSGIFSCKQKHIKFDINKIGQKKWISNGLYINDYQNMNYASELIPKIYRFDIKKLDLMHLKLSFNDLKIISRCVKKCFIYDTVVKYGNGELVSLECIINSFSGAKKVSLHFAWNHTYVTVKSYDDLVVACNGIEKINLNLHSATFSVPQFYESLKKSKNRCVLEVYSNENGQQLDGVINEILETEYFEFVPPVIKCVNRNDTQLIRMIEIQAKEVAKYR